MTIPHKRRVVARNNTGTASENTASEIDASIREPLVLPERDLWDWIGPGGFPDQDSTFFAMTTCFAACAHIEDGRPSEPLIRRIAALAYLSDDWRYQRVISPIINAVESREADGLRAAQRTALCAVLMIAIDQTTWPRDWDSPFYQPNQVWQPGRPSSAREAPS
jgi:hypothetical protein